MSALLLDAASAAEPRLTGFVQAHVAARVDDLEAGRATAFGPVREMGRLGLVPRPADVPRRLALATLLGRTGSLGAAATLLHATGAPLLLLERAGAAALQDRFLAPARAGESCGVAAYPLDGHDGHTVRAHARADGRLQLDGALPAVLGAPGADWAVVPARTDAGAETFVVVALDLPGVGVRRRETIGLHAAALGEVRFEGCRVDASHELDGAARPSEAMDEALADERLLLAGAILGVADVALRGTLAFVGTRRFGPGQTLGDQQAVRHRLADLMADYEMAAAFHREVGDARRWMPAAPARAAMLVLVCVEAARRVAEGCMQLLGARGYMEDQPATRAYRDLLTVGLLAAGDPDALRRAAAGDFFVDACDAPTAPVDRADRGDTRRDAARDGVLDIRDAFAQRARTG